MSTLNDACYSFEKSSQRLGKMKIVLTTRHNTAKEVIMFKM